MSDKRCCVPNCNLTRLNKALMNIKTTTRSENNPAIEENRQETRLGSESKLILHRFPNPEKDSERFNSWLYNIGGDILALKNKFIYKYRRVCHKHFESKYYTWSKGLTRNSVPTLHISDKFLPQNTVSSEQELSKPVHESQESIAPTEVTNSDQLKSSNAVHVRQECTGPENDTTLRQSQMNTEIQGSIVPDTFSWNAQSAPVEIPQDEPEHLDDVPDNLSMYCDDGDTDTVTTRCVNDTGRHEGFHCDNCKGEIVGFRYTCVQCNNLDLCVACESNSAHSHHYMLRVPSPRPYNEIQTILMRIRKDLMTELDPISIPDGDNEDAISVKSDIKSENEEEFEQVDPLCENMPYDDELKEYSTLFSPGSQHSENAVSKETLQNDRPILRPVKVLKVKRDKNRIPLLRVPNNSESKTPPSTAKRKIILSLAEFLKLKESNYLAKKICLTPNKKTEEMSRKPTTLTTKIPKPDVFNTIVKLKKLSPGTTEQEKLCKKLDVMPNNGTKDTNIDQKTLTPIAAGALNPVVKLSKLPPSTLLQRERSGLIEVRPLNSLHKITNTEGIR